MLIADINGHTIMPGNTMEVAGDPDLKFEIVEILPESFVIRWLANKQKGQLETIPFDLFGLKVKVSEITDNIDPNRAFKFRKL